MQMMDMRRPPLKAGAWTKILIGIASVDEETLRLSPEPDWANARAVGAIMLFTWFYQAALFCLITHRLFAAPEEIRPELIFLSVFLATFILLIDSYMVMRSGWHLSGIEELKRGGLDISGGPAARIKAGCFLAVRIMLSIGIAQLTAIFLSLLIFGADINSRAESIYRAANVDLIASAAKLVDAEIQRAVDAVDTETTRYNALAAQATALRQNQIDPSANDPAIQQAQQEVTQLLARKAADDEAVRKAEIFSANELGGIKGALENSGHAGNGPRHRAALEALISARGHADRSSSDLDAARLRLDELRGRFADTSELVRRKSADQTPVFDQAVTAEEAKLAALKDSLARLTQGRGDVVRDAVEHAPGHVALDNGLLAQIKTLELITQGDNKITAVVLLIDLTSFGFELAAVLAKVASYVPTTYAALLARDAYLSSVHIVDDIIAELDDEPAEPDMARSSHPDMASGHDAPMTGDLASITPFEPFGGAEAPNRPVKRPRGRPRKVML